MKKALLIIIIMLLLSLYFYGCGKEEVKFLKAVGTDIVTDNGEGDVIRLIGVNAGGYLVIEEWMCPVASYTQFEMEETLYRRFGSRAGELLDIYMDNWWTDYDFDIIKQTGFNTIRLPFTWRTLQNSDYSFKENAFMRLDEFISEAGKRGLYVILDLHGAHGSQNGRHHSGDVSTGGALYTSEENMRRTLELWVEVAKRYKNNPTVAGYDLLNEPEGVPGGIMLPDTPHWEYYDRLYRAIREVDGNHIIIMEAVWEPMNLPSPSVYGWENVVYEYHFYYGGSQGYDNQNDFIDSKVQMNDAMGHNVPVLVGEFTFYDSPYSWEYGLNVFREQGWSWTIWTHKVTGISSWGLYNLIDDFVRVYPETDSYEEIADKWSSITTQNHCVKNNWLYELILNHIAAPVSEETANN